MLRTSGCSERRRTSCRAEEIRRRQQSCSEEAACKDGPSAGNAEIVEAECVDQAKMVVQMNCGTKVGSDRNTAGRGWDGVGKRICALGTTGE